jgi:hypothetical protein
MIPDYRGWAISWGYGRYTAISPNYDASWEGDEDGWVSNGQCVEARTLEGVHAEIDTWLEENEPASVTGAGTAETRNVAQGEARQNGPQGDAQPSSPSD